MALIGSATFSTDALASSLTEPYYRLSATGGGSGTITAVTGAANEIAVTGSASAPIVGLAPPSPAPTPGSYTNANITLDGFGRITTITSGTPLPIQTVTGTANEITVDNTDLLLPTVSLAAPSPAPTPGAYTNANITVDGLGRITAAANGIPSGGLTSVTGTANQIAITGTSTNPNIGLATPSPNPVAAYYPGINATVDIYGRITTATPASPPTYTIQTGVLTIPAGSFMSNTGQIDNNQQYFGGVLFTQFLGNENYQYIMTYLSPSSFNLEVIGGSNLLAQASFYWVAWCF